ncbi:MAG: ATPase domain-containing protein [Methanomassiliicoccales archaeon]
MLSEGALELGRSGVITRIPTYIEGFDEALEGGIPEGYVLLIAGPPGTMKSTVTCNLLYRNVFDSGSRALYTTLEQSSESLELQASRFGMDFSKVKERFRVIDFAVIRRNLKQLSGKKSWLEVFKMYISNLREAFPFDFIAVDSLDVLEVACHIRDSREELFYLFEWFRELDATVILTSESTTQRMISSVQDEAYLADGIISLSVQDVSDVEAQRRIRCLKLRATNHSMDSFTFITENGKFMAVKAISK